MSSLGKDPALLARRVRAGLDARALTALGGAREDCGDARPGAFLAVLEVCFLEAAADGRVTDEERAHLARLARDLTDGGLGEEALGALLSRCFEGLEREGFHARIARASRTLDADQRALALTLAAAVALGDGALVADERDVFDDLARAFAVPEGDARRVLDAVARVV
ncbi:MAG: TerB family tellurite resistance protein [Deltaproteobacteria bacterium]|nr:TerB family tellurite resistance protein [Deltaproteobacteria bacterium]